MQLKLFHAPYVEYCVNPDCFYDGIFLDLEERIYKAVWDSNLETLVQISHCPSCGEALWGEKIDAIETIT